MPSHLRYKIVYFFKDFLLKKKKKSKGLLHSWKTTKIISVTLSHIYKSLFLSADSQRKRGKRAFIDPLTEVPKLEKWFSENAAPSSNTINLYCRTLNKCKYRSIKPKLEPRVVSNWFMNQRAKVRRMKASFIGQGLCL